MVQLPKEVLLLIWRHIDDLPTKCALSECSRGFHLELRPLLCSSIKKLSAQDLKAGDCSLRRSIECLWRRSDLTQSVQHLEVEKSVKCAYDERFYQSDSEEEIGDITLINLMSISIFHIKEGFLLDVLVKAAKRQRPFNRSNPFPFLQDVELICPQKNEMIWSDYAMPFFYLPAVREISALKAYEGSPGSYTKPDFADYRKPECQVTDIKLIHTIACWGMNEWIAACSKLEHFHLEFGVINSIRHTDGYYTLKAQAFRQSLLSVKDTLKTLHLEFGVSYKAYSKHLTEQSKVNLPFGSFKEFHVLEHLFMRHENLLRLPNAGPVEKHSSDHEPLIRILPKSLKSLAIDDIMRDLFPAL
ncbi:hypothetical protein ASPCADRAFT_130041, partial [Aspergillus carbonarius ITEM 5010]